MILELQDVSKTYVQGDSSKEVLSKINLKINDRTSNLILAHSGSGKSTLINLISLLSPPTGGEIRINDTYTSALSEEESSLLRRQDIGIIRQRDNLFPFLNIEENVKVPQISRDKKEAEHLLREMGFTERDSCPKQLSLFNQQKVALARALINHPSIVLADEPTGDLNSSETVEFLDLLINKTSDSAVLVVSNNYELKEHFDNILYLDEGNLR